MKIFLILLFVVAITTMASSFSLPWYQGICVMISGLMLLLAAVFNWPKEDNERPPMENV